jgi:hypothetical protein
MRLWVDALASERTRVQLSDDEWCLRSQNFAAPHSVAHACVRTYRAGLERPEPWMLRYFYTASTLVGRWMSALNRSRCLCSL